MLSDVFQASRKGCCARVLDKHTALAGSLAEVLHSPISVVADAPGLANHQVCRRQAAVQDIGVIFTSAVMVRKSPTHAFNKVTVAGHAAASAAYTQHGFLL